MCGGALAEHPLQRVRLSRSLALTAAEAAAREQQQSLEESEQSPSGVDRQQRRQRIRRRGAGRRWFTQEHVQELQREGVVFARGKFTAEENAAVEETIARFVGAQRLTAQQVYEKLFHDKTRDSMGRQVRKAFWPALAEALPARQMQALYHHVRRRCHPLNNLGSWTAREDDALRRLVAARGPAWEAISGEMGRMGTNCRDRWRYLQASGRGGDGLPGGD
ncbi:RNA polymerase I enhancer binding protein [Coemansia sp. RSA 2322]|nr:RNA polymerase I enhancer binding protein [Coemansia sp. RSA 2322]